MCPNPRPPLILVNLEVTRKQLVTLFAVGDNTQPVSEAVLLQIFFGEIFQIPFGERHLRSDSDLALALFDGHNSSAKIASFPIHLDSLLEELLLQKPTNERMALPVSKAHQFRPSPNTNPQLSLFKICVCMYTSCMWVRVPWCVSDYQRTTLSLPLRGSKDQT